MRIEDKKCPFCGGERFIEATQDGYAAVRNGFGLRHAALRHVICRDCGSVVRSYVDDPERLLPKRERDS